MSLLLLTTIAPMFLTDRGLPTLAQIGWVLLAGYLMAGGANAVNMWFDRDIDSAMGRTKLRPVPSGRLPAGVALLFGIGLGIFAFALFWRLVTPLAAWLAAAGFLFYVFVYTMWLKRATPQNIVIGGAAGAFPPLVGWAAMTNSLGARLLWYCLSLLQERDASPSPTPWRMYRYSLLYLALLFAAMGVDKYVPFWHRAPPPEIVILGK